VRGGSPTADRIRLLNPRADRLPSHNSPNHPSLNRTRFMNNRNDGLPVFIGIVVLAALAALLAISREIGASFSSVCTAAVPIVLIAAIAFAAWRFLDDFGLPLLATFGLLAWPALWPVLDSIASGGRDSEIYFNPMGDPIINSAWLKWGIEVLLAALVALALYVRHRRRHW
jgi:hypothetical protein